MSWYSDLTPDEKKKHTTKCNIRKRERRLTEPGFQEKESINNASYKLKTKNKRNRDLGFKPLNSYFEGSVAHHPQDEFGKDMIIYIPEILHKSIPHRPSNLKSMETINEMAFNFYDQQLYEKYFGK